ncbi:hypothetical protein QBC37DRAFT_433990 [Rhypophila decipiens]|uniref:Uncharacterized protein n=1 Tax=Rhypophila decipiens TaxID=261697 RepID=A0AAN7B1S5_9PEZI|nr:hypothetical protein QBC37DRAFT_433990 [Rhypophila decipiens]
MCSICALSYLPIHRSSSLDMYALLTYFLITLIFLWVGSSNGRPYEVLGAIASRCIDRRSGSSSHPVEDIIQLLPLLTNDTSGTRFTLSDNLLDPFLLVIGGTTLPFVFVFLLYVIFYITIITCYIIGVMLGLFYVLVTVAFRLFLELLSPLLHVSPRRLGALSIVFSFGAAATVLVWLLLADLLRMRAQMQALAGDEYEDNDWGFGQITAVMTWVPVVQETLFSILRTVRYSRSVAEGRSHDTDRVASVGLLARMDNMEVNDQQTMELEDLTPRVSSGETSDFDSYSKPLLPLSSSGSQTPTRLRTTSSRTPSLQPRLQGSTLWSRTTWPRNESGTYLPV